MLRIWKGEPDLHKRSCRCGRLHEQNLPFSASECKLSFLWDRPVPMLQALGLKASGRWLSTHVMISEQTLMKGKFDHWRGCLAAGLIRSLELLKWKARWLHEQPTCFHVSEALTLALTPLACRNENQALVTIQWKKEEELQ